MTTLFMTRDILTARAALAAASTAFFCVGAWIFYWQRLNRYMFYEVLLLLAPYVAWSLLALIAYATLTPINRRPVVAEQRYEHLGAFALLAFAFCNAYPSKFLPVISSLLGVTIILEMSQTIVPGRHARVIDAAQKCAGLLIGAAFAYLLISWR